MNGFLVQFNSKNEPMQFEMEKEMEGKLPFLEILVARNGNSLSTSVYRKSTHRPLVGLREQPLDMPQKKCVETLWSRADRVCSTTHSLREERSRLRKVFRAKGYSNQMVKTWMAPQRESGRGVTSQDTTRVMIPYVKGASEITARLLREHGVNVAHKPNNTLYGALTRVKDREGKED
ncbi:uncharacterized protein LOC143022048 [Oratosquilla oratoria]|uniref:uncharacterized protein LOC143022048 n=1 Tax=Oratosquilla oratoria TaxID=337810 RepID=UPI003F7629F3